MLLERSFAYTVHDLSRLTVSRLDRSCGLVPMAVPVFESHTKLLEFGVHKLVTRGRSVRSNSYGQF